MVPIRYCLYEKIWLTNFTHNVKFFAMQNKQMVSWTNMIDDIDPYVSHAHQKLFYRGNSLTSGNDGVPHHLHGDGAEKFTVVIAYTC